MHGMLLFQSGAPVQVGGIFYDKDDAYEIAV